MYGISRENILWAEHASICLRLNFVSRGLCRRPWCRELSGMRDHISKCQLKEKCKNNLCATYFDCKEHYHNCDDTDCPFCTKTLYAQLGRFVPEWSEFPSPPSTRYFQLFSEERENMIKYIVKEFRGEVDFTDLEDESLKREIFRAQVIESIAYEAAPNILYYYVLINQEIAEIKF